jgi:hypothetical protein
MASTYSSLKIQLMATGENSGTWGTVTNENLGVALEEAIVGSADVTFASANVTLTLTDTNSTQTARNLRLNLTGTTGGARDLIVPAIEKLYIVNNGCADTVTIKVSGQTGVAVPTGKTMFVYNTGVDCTDAITHLSNLTLATPLAVAQGGTGATTLTGVVIGSGTSAFTVKTNPTGAFVGTTDTQTLTNKTLTDPAITGTILEDVFTITDAAGFSVDPGNGSIQTITLGASRTPVATNFLAGEAITLMVNDGTAYTITWNSATWGGSGVVWATNSGTAPTLATTGFTTIVLWKVGTQVYGARVGDNA